MTSTGKPGDANALAGDFGEAWLHVVAAAAGILHGPPATLDFEKADIELTLLEELPGTYHPSVKAQVKTTHDLRTDQQGNFNYDLEAAAYNILCREDHSSRRVLVVIRLSDDDEKVRLEDAGTLLLGRGAWVSIEGEPPTANTSSQVVKLPAANTLDPEGLRRMLRTCGTNRSSSVPVIDPWKEAP